MIRYGLWHIRNKYEVVDNEYIGAGKPSNPFVLIGSFLAITCFCVKSTTTIFLFICFNNISFRIISPFVFYL